MNHRVYLRLKVIIFIIAALTITHLYGMSWKKTTPDTSKKPIASFLKTKSSTIATPIHREKATREEKKTMSPEQRAQYKVERTATKEAARAAMTEEARKTYDEERAARKIAKAEAAKKPVVAGKQSTQEETSETKPASTRLSTVTTPAKLSTEEIKKLSPAELARYKKQQTAQQEELKAILAEERKTLHSLQTPKERIKYLTQKYGKWVAGAAAFTLLPASAGGLGLGGILGSEDDDAEKTAQQPTVQIFEGGAQPSLGVEGTGFTPEPEKATAPESGPAVETFEAVAPPID